MRLCLYDCVFVLTMIIVSIVQNVTPKLELIRTKPIVQP